MEVQVREQLFPSYWKQWLDDTAALLQDLPQPLNTNEQSPALILRFERWLLLLKVCMLALNLPKLSERPGLASTCMIDHQ